MSESRLFAFNVLYDVISNNAYSNIALDSKLNSLSQRDKAFASMLVYGVIERKLTLDFIIDKYLTKRTKPKVKIILYLGAYQLYFTGVNSAAAINESVELCAKTGCSYYKNLINAVLHKVDNNRIDIESIEDLSVKYSCPQSLINMWTKQYSPETANEILEAINNKPPVFAVANSLFVNSDELQYELLCDDIQSEKVNDRVLMITSAFDLSKCTAFKSGLFHIEDLSSFECAKELGAKSGDTVLDICSAPGGKAFTIAENMENGGTLYAYDLYEHRVKLINDGAKRLGIENIKTDVNDASEYNENIPKANRILCDVPCSGFGVVRRKPEIRYKDLDSVKDLPEIQYKILETSSKYLKPGGRIIYSTCTLNKKENEKVTKRFLDNNSNFTLIKEKTNVPSVTGGDGFYYAVMEKSND